MNHEISPRPQTYPQNFLKRDLSAWLSSLFTHMPTPPHPQPAFEEFSPRMLAARVLSGMPLEETPAVATSPSVFRRRPGTTWRSASAGLELGKGHESAPAPAPNSHFYAPYPKVRHQHLAQRAQLQPPFLQSQADKHLTILRA